MIERAMSDKLDDVIFNNAVFQSIFPELATVRVRLVMVSFHLDKFLDPNESVDISFGTSFINGVTNRNVLSFLTESIRILDALKSPADISALIIEQSKNDEKSSEIYAGKISNTIKSINAILDDLELVLAVDLKSSSIKLKQSTRQWYALQLAKLLSLARHLKSDHTIMIDSDETVLKRLAKMSDEGKGSGFAKSIALNLRNDLSKQLERDARKARNYIDSLVDIKNSATENYESIKKQSLLIEKQYEMLRNVDTHFEEAKKKIDEHLENANKIGLAKSFQDRRKSLEDTQKLWGVVFLTGIALMAGGVIYEQGMLPPIVSKNGVDINAVLVRMLFAAPLVWLTWFAARQFGNNARLIEDYAFKESSALAYQGYKNEFLADQDHETMTVLRKVAAENFGANPTRMLPGQEAASPLHELLEGALKKEGFDKIVTVLHALNPKAKDDSAAKKDDKKDDKKEE
jgi:hypothetical protein